MKLTFFLVHDAGGYNALFPLVKRYLEEGLDLEFYCAGPSAVLAPKYGGDDEEILARLETHIRARTIQLLVTGTSWGSKFELLAIKLCKGAGIKTVSILDYWSNYRLRFTEEDQRTTIYPDYYIVMDELAKEEAKMEGVPEQILHVLGQPGLDGVIRPRQRHWRPQPPRPIRKKLGHQQNVLLLSQPVSELYANELGYTELQVMEDCLQAFACSDQWNLNIRFHPKDNPSLKHCYAHKAASSSVALPDLLPDYQLVIGMTSFGLLQAVLLGIPALSYQPNLKQIDSCITNKLNLTKIVTSYDALVEEVIKFRQAGPSDYDLGRLKTFIWSDGQSTNRVFQFVREVVAHEGN